MLNRRFANAPLTVDQQAVVMDGLQDAIDQVLATEEHGILEYRRSSDVRVESARAHQLAMSRAAPEQGGGKRGRDTED